LCLLGLDNTNIECGKHTAANVVAKAQAVLSEAVLLRAMFDVGYFPPNTPWEPQYYWSRC
jgi:hypothetical protein